MIVAMTTHDRIQALLVEAERAHAAYEAAELGGTYDEAWPRWYAAYAIDHGIGDILGRDLSLEGLTDALAASWDELQASDPPTDEPWASFAARRIADL